MLGYQGGLAPAGQSFESAQVIKIEWIRRPERHPHAMQAQRIGRSNAHQALDLHTTVGEVILAVYFQPGDRWALSRDTVLMRSAKADSSYRRNRPCKCRSIDERHSYQPLFRLPPLIRSQVPFG